MDRKQKIDIGGGINAPGGVSFGDGARHHSDGHAGPAGKETAPDRAPGRKGKAKRVFVIYGRDSEASDAVFEFLRALGLRPQEWEHLVSATNSASPSLADVVTRAARDAQAVVALLTPDDLVQLHPSLVSGGDTSEERGAGCQARPNVYLELGIALAVLPERTIILEAGVVRRPADLAGLNYVTIGESGEWLNKVAQRLKSAGCPVDRSGTDWQRTSRFTNLAAYHRCPGS